MDDEAARSADEDRGSLDAAVTEPVAELDDVADDEVADDGGHAEIIDLPWDEDLPIALGEETDVRDGPDGAGTGDPDAAGDAGGTEGRSDWEHDYEFDEGGHRADEYFARKRAERRVDSWRTRSATGAIATAIAMGLQQVFEPEKRRPAAVAEAPSDPYSDDDPITVEYVPDDAEATTVRVKPWLLQKGDPS